jgi:Flp pilus assembly protein TadG
MFYQRERAQGIVEFALVLPLLLVLILGIIEAGRLLFVYSAVNSASREGARYGSASGDVGGYVAYYEDCAGIKAAAKRVGVLGNIQDDNIAISYDHGPNTSVFSSDCPVPAGEFVTLGDRIIVQVTTTFDPIVPLVNLPAIPISSVSRRTILKSVRIEGTPAPAVPTNTPTATNSPTPTITNTPTATATNTSTPTATSTATHTNTPEPDETTPPPPTSTPTNPPPTATPIPACVIDSGPLSFGSESLSWTLTNLSADPVILSSLSADWPDDRPKTKLQSVTIAGALNWTGNTENSISICSTCWNQGLPSDRQFGVNGVKTIVLDYSRVLYSGLYNLEATFENLTSGGTCTVSTQAEYTAP